MNGIARQETGALLEQVVIQGNLDRMSPADRMEYYRAVCESVGLNPLTRPFDYIKLSGRLTLYARKDATDQLRSLHRVSVAIVNRERVEDVYIVTARATMPDGRTDESTGAVTIGKLRGDALANALMKAETKAKRRVTLSICGLGLLDETEAETIPGAAVEVAELPAPVPTPAPALDTLPICEGCDGVIEPSEKATAEQIAAWTVKQFGRRLCRSCFQQEGAQ